MLIKIKNKKQNKFIVSERLYIGITDTINGFRSTLACCEVSIADTHYGRHAALKERELEAAMDSMSRDKRNELRQKLDECEMEDEATHMLAANKRKGQCLRMERQERFRYH